MPSIIYKNQNNNNYKKERIVIETQEPVSLTNEWKKIPFRGEGFKILSNTFQHDIIDTEEQKLLASKHDDPIYQLVYEFNVSGEHEDPIEIFVRFKIPAPIEDVISFPKGNGVGFVFTMPMEQFFSHTRTVYIADSWKRFGCFMEMKISKENNNPIILGERLLFITKL